jgi:hypothetical protein
MQLPLLTAALLGLTVTLTGSTTAHAQFLPPEAAITSTSTTSEPPNPFPLVPIATTTQPETTPKEGATTTVEKPLTTVATTTSAPAPTTPKKKVTPAPVAKKKTPTPVTSTITETATTSTATTTPPLLPPALTTQQEPVGDVYLYTRHAPLNTEDTQVLLGLAVLSALAGFLLAQKRFLENTSYTIGRLFSPRSLSQPQTKRQ